MKEVLELLKIDLGITHNKRDAYFNALLSSVKKELENKGLVIDIVEVDDQMLLSDYAAWQYRKRQEDVPLARNLDWRIKNRIVKERAKHDQAQCTR